MLVPEPENEFDKDAIAVHIDYGQGQVLLATFQGNLPSIYTLYLNQDR